MPSNSRHRRWPSFEFWGQPIQLFRPVRYWTDKPISVHCLSGSGTEPWGEGVEGGGFQPVTPIQNALLRTAMQHTG